VNKSTAWKWFSKYVRLRDALKTTGTSDLLRCVTCGKVVKVSEAHAGHGIGGRTNGILFDEEIVNGQCIECNYFKKGNYERYVPILVKKHGSMWYNLKMLQAKTPTKIDLKEEAKKWRLKYKELEKEAKERGR